MPSTCEFTFSKKDGVFFAGRDDIEGTVTLTTTNDKDVECVNINIWGGSKCLCLVSTNFMENDDDWEVQRFELSSRETFIENTIKVATEGILSAGEHIWPFTFLLDAECFTSVESRYGHIRYQVYLEIINKNEKYKNIFTKPLTVIKVYDLNNFDSLKTGKECDVTTTCCCGLFKGKIFYRLRTPYSGYAPGQMLQYTFEIHNKASQRIVCYEVRLLRIVHVVCDIPKYYKKETEQILYEREVPDNDENYQLIVDEIFIKPTAPTFKTDYISVKYALRISTKLSSCYSDLKAEVDITIGTVPLKETLTPQEVAALYTADPEFEIAAQIDKDFVDSTTPEINRVVGFLPHYPTYRPNRN